MHNFSGFTKAGSDDEYHHHAMTHHRVETTVVSHCWIAAFPQMQRNKTDRFMKSLQSVW